MMNRLAKCVFLALAFVTAWCPAVIAAGDAPETGFVNKVFRQAGHESMYVVFIPHNYDGSKPYPTILFLHGLGQSGTDGLAQAGRGLATAIRKREHDFPFIVVFPQSHDRTWLADSTDGKRAVAILDCVGQNYRVEINRVYLTGYSMGGEGTFSIAAAHPNRFAAIVPICGGIDTSIAPKLKNTPIWCFVGDADAVSTVTDLRLLMRAITKAGGRPIYHEYPGVGHDCWDQTYDNPDVYEWLLTHKLR
ncbi:MAG: alpha/beta hydrolase-fold protein [Planctomycetota bacterium]|nr:alpha/beta hydrolase-fold protein [Planctomycetota bacterium]